MPSGKLFFNLIQKSDRQETYRRKFEANFRKWLDAKTARLKSAECLMLPPENWESLAQGHNIINKLRLERLRKKDFSGFIQTFSSHDRFKPFLKIIPRLSPAEYWKLLGEVWIDIEVIQPDQQTWLRLFQSKRPSRENLMTSEEHEMLAKMPAILEIWRGCGDESGVYGLSWTLDRKRAESFADYAIGIRRQNLSGVQIQRDVKPIIVKAKCKKSDALAYFAAREEAEIVINPKHVTVLKTFSWSPKA